MSSDTASYVGPAKALLEDQRFSVSPGDPDPMFSRTPGYPLYLAAVFVVSGHSETAALTVQVLLSVVTVWLAFVVAAMLFGKSAGIVAAGVNILDPSQFRASGVLLTESITALVMLAFVAVGYRVLSRRPAPALWAVLLGLVLAVATLIRPTTYYLPVVVIPLLVVARWRRGLREWATIVAAFVLPVAVLVGGWQVRNKHAVDSFRFSGIEAVNMYGVRAAGVLALNNGTSYAEEQRRLLDELGPIPTGPHKGPFYDRMYDKGLEIVTSHPIEALRMTIAGLVRETAGIGVETVFPYLRIAPSTPLKVIFVLGLFGFWLAVSAGIVASRRDRAHWLGHALSLGTVAYVLLISAGPEAYSRFRVPVTPIVSLFAALGIVRVAALVRDVIGARGGRLQGTRAAELPDEHGPRF